MQTHNSPAENSNFEIFLFEKGSETHTLDFMDLPLKNNCVHFVTPGQVHRDKSKPDSIGGVMMFTYEFF